ncbi:GMC oxidoreductase [Colletotrichum karsti]|uniref:GMC oxidoreductase n=1 Tax=Colletotrichum karsti TaxID=1095194 RepID=A0A9P6LLK7_9PEZI|nr:GMC oxidoreductase [Colletotrichum karsti]KAF9880529.1 GMC oxidoreductase [Colletotrichum karsti]
MIWPFGVTYPQCRVTDVEGKTFDYILVGGGTAGCAVASRLSEDPHVSVLLICNGKIEDSWIHSIPIVGNARENRGADIDTIHSEPDEQWDGVKVRCFTSRSLGGASNLNGLMYTRGPPSNYNQWAALGNDQWSFEKCEPYFKKLENASSQPGASYRGHNGPIHLRQDPPVTSIDAYIQQAARDMDLPVRNDMNNPKAPPEGLYTIEHMIDQSGYRHSAVAAYLPKSLVIQRQNRLTICSGGIATRLRFSEDGSEAEGVYVLDHLNKKSGKECLVHARREVIICCGSLFTPQLLIGIGPKQHLEDLKIPLIRNLPGVGANLHDHVSFGISFQVRFSDSYLCLQNPLVAIWMLFLFVFYRIGILSTCGGRLCAFVQSKNIDDSTMRVKSCESGTDPSLPENLPDVEVLFVNAAHNPEIWKGYCAFLATLVQPCSRGRIELASSDPLALPRFHFQHFKDPRDMVVARKAARFAMNYVDTFRKTKYPYSSAWHLAPGVTKGTGEGSWRDVTDDQIDDYLKRQTVNFYHPTSTCRMALEGDGGVVGQDMKVHGVKNLRIADASVFPTNTSAHPVAAVYMVAERCADFVKSGWAEKA